MELSMADYVVIRGSTEWIEAMGRWTLTEIRACIANKIRNVRIAQLWDWDDMEEYFRRRALTTEANFDMVLKSPVDGKMYLVGCEHFADSEIGEPDEQGGQTEAPSEADL